MRGSLLVCLSIGVAASAAPLGCSHREEKPASPVLLRASFAVAAASVATPDLHARVPSAGGSFAPAQSEVTGPGLDGATVTETESCAGCHADTAAQWRVSAHAFGSFNNPAYRVAIDRFRTDVSKDASRFCAGCHDVALLVDGAMANDVLPTDSRAHGGVTCRVCHGVESARSDGNGSYTLASSIVPIPKDGDPESVRAHKARMAPEPLRTAQMCGTCHRSFLTDDTGNVAHLVGMDELSSWSQSAYAGSLAARVDELIPETSCQGCHMPKDDAPGNDAAAKDGKVSSHRFLGGHTWLAAMQGDDEQLRRAQAFLRGAASIDVAVLVHADGTRSLPADGAALRASETVVLDVVVRNERVGHRFPGGTLDAQDVWVELEVRDAGGALVAEAGAHQATSDDDPTAHVLRAVQADDAGRPLLLRETNRFRATVFNHTIAPRDAELVRFRFETPKDLTSDMLPLRVSAKLRHRSRNLAIARATCGESKTPRGAAFAKEVARRTSRALDACAAEPVTEIAESVVFVGEGWDAMAHEGSSPPKPLWRRLFDHATGALHAVQEQADDARPSLERALAETRAGSRERGMVLALFAQVAARQGRTEEAEKWIAEAMTARGAEDDVSSHPALAATRAESLATVWRWKDAIAPLREVADASPHDDRAWSRLAVAYGSDGDSTSALWAAMRGLLLAPRDPDLLRVQALALAALHAPNEEVDAAKTAYLEFRSPDDAPRIRGLCSKNVPGCALERIPVHVHETRAAPR